jgi:hypothetical protein
MPITMNWYSRSAVLVTYTDLITAKGQHEANLKFIAYLEAASHPLHVIADWRNADNYPIDFDIVPDMLTMLRHKNMGWIVVVGMNNVLSFWAEFFTKMAGLHYTQCRSIEEATQFLALRESDKTA